MTHERKISLATTSLMLVTAVILFTIALDLSLLESFLVTLALRCVVTA